MAPVPVVTADIERSMAMVDTALVIKDPMTETGDQGEAMLTEVTDILILGLAGRQTRTAVNRLPREIDGRVMLVQLETETGGMTDLL